MIKLSRPSRWLLLYLAERYPLGIATTIPLPFDDWRDKPGMVHMNGLVKRGWARIDKHIYFITDAGKQAAQQQQTKPMIKEATETDNGASKPKRTRKKQPDLPEMKGPGVEKATHKDIEDAADEYVDIRDKRQKMSIEEKQRKGKLLGAMKAAGLTVYDYDGKIVTVSPKDETETVKVKTKDKDETDIEVVDD